MASNPKSCLIGLMLMLLGLAGCTTSEPGGKVNVLPLPNPHQGADIETAQFVDEARTIARFSDGVCRSLTKVRPPWVIHRIDAQGIHLVTPSDLFFPSAQLADFPEQKEISVSFSAAGRNVYEDRLKPWLAPTFEVQETFDELPEAAGEFRRYVRGLHIMLVSKSNKSVAHCLNEKLKSEMPNPYCVLLDFDRYPGELIALSMSQWGLSKLHEVNVAAAELAGSLIVPCPKGN